jgi:glycosyltransferase involved in cell wall biosynthesis
VVHAFWADEPGWVAAIAARLIGAPLLVSLAGGELVRLPDIAYGLERLRGRRTLVRWTLGRASAVTAGSRYLLDLARTRLGGGRLDRLRLAPLGVDCDRFRPGARQRLAGPPQLLNVGSLTPVKAQGDLIRAIRLVPHARLRIVGGGSLQGELGALAESCGVAGRVEIAGEIDHAAMPDAYRSADLFVQASRHEAQGMATLEAAASGVPVAGTPVGVLPDVGVTAPIESLAGAIAALAREADRLVRLGRECRERVLADYSLPIAMSRFLRVYEEITGRPSPPARTPPPSPAPPSPR